MKNYKRRDRRRKAYRKRNGQRLTFAEYKSRRKKEIICHLAIFVACFICAIVGIATVITKLNVKKKLPSKASNEAASTQQQDVVDTIIKDVEIKPYKTKSADADAFFKGYDIEYNNEAATIDEENMISKYAVLINLDTKEVVAAKDGNERISPASMTKILTLLVAAENIKSLDDTCVMTKEISDYIYSNDCSNVGLVPGDVQTVRDLLYGTILPSGADAALLLANYVAGSQEAFVDLMNKKLEDLGLSDTAHFTNCIGLFDEDHYCTPLDIAMILKAAEENELCHEVLSARKYVTTPTAGFPSGKELSNLFLRRIEDKDTHGEVMGAKTGFVHQAGSCGASYKISNDGTHYICVTANSTSSWRCIYDHVDIYETFTS